MCGQSSGYNYAQAQAQAQAQRQPMTAKEAANDLARLMERQIGKPDGDIDSIALRLFIRAYWSRISKMAHIIHDEA